MAPTLGTQNQQRAILCVLRGCYRSPETLDATISVTLSTSGLPTTIATCIARAQPIYESPLRRVIPVSQRLGIFPECLS